VPKRRTCALISFSTHSSTGIVRLDASVLRSAASWPRLCLRQHLHLAVQEVNSRNGQTEGLAFPQAQADTQSHGNAVARG
jgi:hypothetical protein